MIRREGYTAKQWMARLLSGRTTEDPHSRKLLALRRSGPEAADELVAAVWKRSRATGIHVSAGTSGTKQTVRIETGKPWFGWCLTMRQLKSEPQGNTWTPVGPIAITCVRIAVAITVIGSTIPISIWAVIWTIISVSPIARAITVTAPIPITDFLESSCSPYANCSGIRLRTG